MANLVLRYPNIITGAIAGSAPIWGFPLTNPPTEGASVAITRGLMAAGGAPDNCASNLRSAIILMHDVARLLGSDGAMLIAKAARQCSTKPFTDPDNMQ